MMLRCPHCREPGLRWLRLLLSTESGPTKCEICGKMAHTSSTLSFVANFLATPIFFGSLAFALYHHSWWPMIAFSSFAVAYPVGLLLLPATATNYVAAKRARRAQVISVVVVLLSIIAAGVFLK